MVWPRGSVGRWKAAFLVVVLTQSLFSCAFLPGDSRYAGPAERPMLLESYYDKGSSYSTYTVQPLRESEYFSAKRYILSTQYGDATVDYFACPEKSDSVVFVFPLLGGKNDVVDHFAEYFARKGFDAAIIHRNQEFKDPKNFDRLEEMLRIGLVRDRIVIDFFEREMAKSKFGSFGISRGAINAALLAGVDKRLKYNVFALGGSDLVSIYTNSDERKPKKYKSAVMAEKGITEHDFLQILRAQLKSDPEYLSRYIDAKNTLLVLALFDATVPIKYGRRLRKQIGNPDTVFLVANHYTSVLYTAFVPMLTKNEDLSMFPMGYVEMEAVNFYTKSFTKQQSTLRMIPIRILQFPFNIIGKLIDTIF